MWWPRFSLRRRLPLSECERKLNKIALGLDATNLDGSFTFDS